MLVLSNLSKHYGGRTLFEGVSMQLVAPARYGVVGANGSGKSTFLRILTGEEAQSDGEVQLPKRTKVGVLAQDRFESLDQPVREVAMMGDEELWATHTEREALLSKADTGDFDAARYAEVEERYTALGGYGLAARASEILEGLGIPTALHQGPLAALSGGFQLRALLAQTLAAQPDVLLLDEPTNHLDIVSIRWLEEFLQTYEGLAVIVSHDHQFLDRICTHILDVDYERVTHYTGDYSAFEAAKAETRQREEKAQARRTKEIEETRRFIERFKAKATKARQAQSRAKQLAKVEAQLEDLPPSSRRYPSFHFTQTRPSGREVLKVEHLDKAYGDARVLEDVGFSIRRGERIAIVGANGVGKSTLLKTLVGVTARDAGTVTWGHEAQIGYFPQDHRDALGTEGTVLSWLWDAVPAETTSVVRGHLGRVLFEGDDVDKRVTDLSGGEAARLLFCRMMLEHPNIMVLDEPTNHLDMESIESLAAALESYDGTLLFVSHDRWFVSALATRVLEVKPGETFDYPGTWEEFLAHQGEDHLDTEAVLAKQRAEAAPKEAPKNAQADREQRKAAARERKRLETERDRAMAEVEQLEERKAAIEARFCEDGFFTDTPPDDIAALHNEQAAIEEKVLDAMERWESAEQGLAALED